MARRSTNLLLAALLAPITLIAAAAIPADTHADSVKIASQIVQQLQTLGHHEAHSPFAAPNTVSLQVLPSSMLYETAAYYKEPKYRLHDYYKLHAEPPSSTMAPNNLTPSGINVQAALGYISFLRLLLQVENEVEEIAARVPFHRRRRNASWPRTYIQDWKLRSKFGR